jgi:signal transduction histidine kinase
MADQNKTRYETGSLVSSLQQKIHELNEQNWKLKAELLETQQIEDNLNCKLGHLESLIENAPNFAAYRVIADSDYSTHDLEHYLKSRDPDYDYWPIRVVYVSPNFQELTDIERIDDHKGWYNQIHPDDLELFIAAQETIKETSALDLVYRKFHSHKQEWRWFHLIVKGTPDQTGLAKFFNGIIIDITDYKRVEHKLLTHQERLRALNDEVLNTEERERRRIAGILHDSIGQKLFAAKWELERLAARGMDNEEALTQAFNHIDSCITEARSLTAELYPRDLYEFGLTTALKRLTDNYRKRFGLAVAFSGQADKHIDDETKLLIFRTTSELINNVAKHAQARKVTIAITNKETAIRVSVTDDGVGFNYIQEPGVHDKGFGLFSIQERLQRVGGMLRFEKPHEGGAKVVIEAPLSG